MRPRDLLTFLQMCIEVALNRGHAMIEAEDILQAEQSYSQEALIQTAAEVEGTSPECAAAMLEFRGVETRLTPTAVSDVLKAAGIPDDQLQSTTELLVWFGFLGVTGRGFADDTYSHSVQFNMRALLQPVERGNASFVVHPAFHRALELQA